LATGQEIADEVRLQLNDNDTSNYRWSDAELLGYINAGGRQIVLLMPEANVVREQTTIAAGSGSRQSLPANGVKFFDVANYDATLGEPGPPIRAVERDVLDTFMPEWSYESAIAARWSWDDAESKYTNVRFESHFHDPRQPKEYFLFPPADASTGFDVFLTFSKLPTALTVLGDTYGLNDEYINATVDYVTYRCLMKDGRYGLGPEERRELWNNFLRTLGLKIESDGRVDPNRSRPPEDANG
jgi:hypothetical protein